MSFFFYIFLGLAPSVIWLLFYLRKDKLPESNSMVVKTFILGMLLAPLALIGEYGFNQLIEILPFSNSVLWTETIIKFFLIQALSPGIVEEFLKFIAVKFRSIKTPEFDEPVDIVIYCIIVGLGFAAVENLLSVFSYANFTDAFQNVIFRFWGATLLHAIATGMIGYWLAQAIYKRKNQKKLITIGVLIAIFFHTCYNVFVVIAINFANLAFISIAFIFLLLFSGSIILSYQFKKLKKQKSICKTYPSN